MFCMVNEKINDMFEEQQNTGKSVSLAEIRAEVERLVAEERKRIKAEVEAEYAKQSEELKAQKLELEQREAKLDEKAEALAQMSLTCDANSNHGCLNNNNRILSENVAHAHHLMELAMKENPKLAKVGMMFYQSIYLVEVMMMKQGLQGAQKAQFRKDNAEPIWGSFKLWASSAILGLPQESLIFKALNYLLRHYQELTNYIDIPEMPLDNNQTMSL